MVPDMDDLFDDFEKANPSHKPSGNKIKVAGTHLVKVQDVRMQPSELVATDYFVVEFEVVESTHNDLNAGESYSWTCDPKRKFGKNKVGQNDIKQFVCALAGFDPNDETAKSKINKGHLRMILNGEDPTDDVGRGIASNIGSGALVKVETIPKTSKDGRPWTQHLWSPHPGE